MESLKMEKLSVKEWTIFLIRAFSGIIIIGILIFGSAGTFDYWQGWVGLGAHILTMIGALFLLRDRPALMRERIRPGGGMKRWDKYLLAIIFSSYFAEMIVAGLDVGRFGWSGEIPAILYIICWLLFLAGYGVVFWATYVNDYFSSVVRLQKDRGQVVVQEGPYQYVRHPGYISGLVAYLVLGVGLGSYYAFIPGFIAAGGLVIRTHLEDKTLKNELPGYTEYAEKVKYRLIPGVW
jgi:protein-S-isoprenylcysteine O-methyltransferase Ste14